MAQTPFRRKMAINPPITATPYNASQVQAYISSAIQADINFRKNLPLDGKLEEQIEKAVMTHVIALAEKMAMSMTFEMFTSLLNKESGEIRQMKELSTTTYVEYEHKVKYYPPKDKKPRRERYTEYPYRKLGSSEDKKADDYFSTSTRSEYIGRFIETELFGLPYGGNEPDPDMGALGELKASIEGMDSLEVGGIHFSEAGTLTAKPKSYPTTSAEINQVGGASGQPLTYDLGRVSTDIDTKLLEVQLGMYKMIKKMDNLVLSKYTIEGERTPGAPITIRIKEMVLFYHLLTEQIYDYLMYELNFLNNIKQTSKMKHPDYMQFKSLINISMGPYEFNPDTLTWSKKIEVKFNSVRKIERLAKLYLSHKYIIKDYKLVSVVSAIFEAALKEGRFVVVDTAEEDSRR